MSGDKKTDPKAGQPAIPGTGPMMTQPAFMGDNQNMLAQQLAAGGYGTQPDLMAMLSQTFTPMQVFDTRPGATPTPSTPAPSSQNNDSGLAGLLASLTGNDFLNSLLTKPGNKAAAAQYNNPNRNLVLTGGQLGAGGFLARR